MGRPFPLSPPGERAGREGRERCNRTPLSARRVAHSLREAASLRRRGEVIGRADMLSRTADNLYWLSRYTERADFVARILDATLRLASLPSSYGGERNEWESAVAVGRRPRRVQAPLRRRQRGHGPRLPRLQPEQPVLDPQLHRDRARERPRRAHGADRRDVGRDQRRLARAAAASTSADMSREEFARFLDWVKGVSLAFDGSAYRTMLRNDAFWFTRLGTAIERADNTARILDVKYHVLLPETERVGGSRSTTSSGRRSCARSRRSPPITGSTGRASSPGSSPTSSSSTARCRARSPTATRSSSATSISSPTPTAGADRASAWPATRWPASRARASRASSQSGLHEFIDEFIGENNKLGAGHRRAVSCVRPVGAVPARGSRL